MSFPVFVFGIHPHHVFDFLAFLVGGRLFWRSLRRDDAMRLTTDQKLVLAAWCIVGAAIGAKLLVLLEDPRVTLANWRNPAVWVSGKTIVGGLLGGTLGVEWGKRQAGIAQRTGDHFVVPILVGLAIGRIGCFLSGLTDDAYGDPTTLPWGIDFGDGPRHPTQLYEVAFALALLALAPRWLARAQVRGDVFQLVMVGYYGFRFVEEFVRASATPYLGLSIYQLACLAGVVYHLRDAPTRARLARLMRGTGAIDRMASSTPQEVPPS